MKFRDIVLEEDYYKAIKILEENEYKKDILSESFIDSLKDLGYSINSNIKKILKFIQTLISFTSYKVSELLDYFKNKKIYEIFKTIGFSIKKIISLYKKGVDTYNSIQDIIARKITELGGVKYIKKNLDKLDEFLKTHPKLKKLGGIAVAGLLFYIWTQMSFTPDLEYSMDFKDIILALGGHFSLSELFASESGIAMLIYFTTGMLLGISMPWPGKQTYHIISGLIWSAYKLVKPKGVVLTQPSP